jgi:hypothetical protein
MYLMYKYFKIDCSITNVTSSSQNFVQVKKQAKQSPTLYLDGVLAEDGQNDESSNILDLESIAHIPVWMKNSR